mmetsp:Transcript_1515/g.3239  ORF Transcript_1515/g.3239 Transcript_1515/m.3239 type:complete len:245 (-) Transcript_1515:257-991(-)
MSVVVVVGVSVVASTSHRGGILDAVRLGNSFQEAAFQIAELRPGLLDLFRRETIKIGRPAPKDLFPDAVGSDKFFGYPHGIAVQEFAQKGSERGSVREGQETRLEFLYQSVGVGFFFRCPLAPSELLSLLFGASSRRLALLLDLLLLLLLLLLALDRQMGLCRCHDHGRCLVGSVAILATIDVTIVAVLVDSALISDIDIDAVLGAIRRCYGFLLQGFHHSVGFGCGLSRLHQQGLHPCIRHSM